MGAYGRVIIAPTRDITQLFSRLIFASGYLHGYIYNVEPEHMEKSEANIDI